MNRWLWFHILGGGVLGYVFNLRYDPQVAVLMVLMVAIGWEVYEFIVDDVERIYGSYKRFYLDALQDIAGAVFNAILVVL